MPYCRIRFKWSKALKKYPFFLFSFKLLSLFIFKFSSCFVSLSLKMVLKKITLLILLFLLVTFTWTVSSMFCFSLSLSLNYFLQPPAFSKAALSGKFEAEHWTIILIISMDNNHLNFGQICCDCTSVKVWPDFAPSSRRRPTPLTLYFISFLESIIVLLCFFKATPLTLISLSCILLYLYFNLFELYLNLYFLICNSSDLPLTHSIASARLFSADLLAAPDSHLILFFFSIVFVFMLVFIVLTNKTCCSAFCWHWSTQWLDLLMVIVVAIVVLHLLLLFLFFVCLLGISLCWHWDARLDLQVGFT